MGFKLPKYSELTDSQRVIVNLPLDKNHLVTGAPGTGKSVIAIYRASDMANAGKDVLMLVYNKPLKMYIASAVDDLDIDADVNTWQSWLPEFYREHTGTSYPNLGEAFTYDWLKIKSKFKSIGRQYDQVIIDEAQDVPIELIESLLLISKGVTCFMDPKQTLSDNFTDYEDVADALGVRSAYKLYENFRNPKGIYDFAKLYNKDEETKMVKRDSSKPLMIQCSDYGHASSKSLTSQMVRIIKRNFGLNYIGVFVNNKSQNITYKELTEELDDMDVYMFKAGNYEFSSLDFDEPGVYVLSYGTMKGLEFDAVLLPRCECITSKGDIHTDKNVFYVAATRASEKLFCFYFDKRSSSKYIDVFSPIKGNEKLLDWE